MYNIPDAPWVRDPETHADEYYYGCYEEEEEKEEFYGTEKDQYDERRGSS